MQIGTGNFFVVEFDQDFLSEGLLDQERVFLFGTVAPKNVLRLRESGHVLNPIEHGLVRRFRIANSFRRRDSR